MEHNNSHSAKTVNVFYFSTTCTPEYLLLNETVLFKTRHTVTVKTDHEDRDELLELHSTTTQCVLHCSSNLFVLPTIQNWV